MTTNKGQRRYRRGAFIAYRRAEDAQGSKKVVIPFRFNPQTLSRSLRLEQGEGVSGTQGASGSGSPQRDQSSNPESGRLIQTFSVLVRVDLDDRLEAGKNLPVELGVLPELSVLESLLYGEESPEDYASDGNEPVRQGPVRPTVFFHWGEKRIFPVRITGMDIDETMFNEALNPTRAEIDVQLEVIGDRPGIDSQKVRSAWTQLENHRREWTNKYIENTADQGKHYSDPPIGE